MHGALSDAGEGPVAEALGIAASAAAAFPAWAATGPGERRRLLLASADLLVRRSAEVAALMRSEIAATPAFAARNVALGAALLREAASMTTQVTGDIIPSDRPGCLAMAMREPAGVVLGIAPWNAPVVLGLRAVAMPLACGNTTILKASELSPATHALLGAIFSEAGFPAGVVGVVSTAAADAPAVVGALIAHEAVRRVNFTGSTAVGRIIGQTAARHLKPALLELGGKSPLLVLDDADLAAAAGAAALGAFTNQGQICMSTERLIVDHSVADEFAAMMKAECGRWTHEETGGALGSMVSAAAAGRVQELVDDALAKGAVLVAGGGAEGAFMPATVLDYVTRDMRIYAEESFGPIAAIIRVEGVDAAIEVANDSEFGLAAAVFSREAARALSIARRIRSGICHINSPTLHNEPQMPFGGVGASGYGRFGSRYEIAEFTDLKWVTIPL